MVCDLIDLFELLKQGISMLFTYCRSCMSVLPLVYVRTAALAPVLALCIVNFELVKVYCDSQDYQ